MADFVKSEYLTLSFRLLETITKVILAHEYVIMRP